MIALWLSLAFFGGFSFAVFVGALLRPDLSRENDRLHAALNASLNRSAHLGRELMRAYNHPSMRSTVEKMAGAPWN